MPTPKINYVTDFVQVRDLTYETLWLIHYIIILLYALERIQRDKAYAS